MNKTLKTIAWICLALGLLGIAADAGLFFYSRALLNERQTAMEEILQSLEEGDLPSKWKDCRDGDIDDDGETDEECENLRGRGFGVVDRRSFMGRFDRGGYPQGRQMPFGRGIIAGSTFLPLFFVAAGPVLAVVGAVILLVNCEPREKEEKEIKQEPPKEKTVRKK